MEERYHISGMTCENCRGSVHEKINSVSVFLDKEEALVQLETHIEVLGIKQILGSKHTVQEVPIKSSLAQSQSQSKWKSLFPLFLIFGYLISGTTFFK